MALVEKSEEKTKTVNAEKTSIEDIRKKLFDQITNLQSEISDLKKIKQKYGRLKIRYKELLNEKNKIEKSSSDSAEKELTDKKLKIINKAESSSDNMINGVEEYEQKITELKDTIEKLRESLLKCSTNNSPNEKDSLNTIEKLGESINNSSETANNVKQSIDDFKNELKIYKTKVAELEQELATSDIADKTSKNKYTILSKPVVGSSDSDVSLEKNTLENFEELQNEVSKLRKSTAEQREIIFNLEGKIKSLRDEINNNVTQDSEREEKEVQLTSLERKLTETEGCIDILESEIEYLNDKLSEIQENPLQEKNQNSIPNTTTITQDITCLPPITFKEQISNIISSTEIASIDSALEVITTEILDAIEPMNLDIFLLVESTLGQLEVSAKDNWDPADKSFIQDRLNSNKFLCETNGNSLRIASYHIGILAIPENIEKQKRPISDYEEPISIISLVANAIIDSLEKRKKSTGNHLEFKKAINTVQSDTKKIQIQQNYQSMESQKILDTFLVDLNNSLNTMNITENQSAFFDAMIKEVKERMDLLHATQSSVKEEYASMIKKLEKKGETLFNP